MDVPKEIIYGETMVIFPQKTNRCYCVPPFTKGGQGDFLFVGNPMRASSKRKLLEH
uniref:Uncharacterized protein n=1 Tax=Geobacter sp. (strain M21) TaxID=443144 RepID=C6E923_GEOSM